MYPLASDFILLAPRCVSCSSSNAAFRPGGGTITHAPQRTQPLSMLSSSLLDVKGLKSFPKSPFGQPCSKYWRTFDSVGSVSVHLLMWLAVIVVVDR